MDKGLGDLTVSMSKQLAMARQNLSLVELRVTRACIAKLGAGLTADGGHDVWLSAREYAEAYGLSLNAAYDELKGVAATLPSKRVIFQDGATARWVDDVEYPTRAGALRLRFSAELLPHITQ